MVLVSSIYFPDYFKQYLLLLRLVCLSERNILRTSDVTANDLWALMAHESFYKMPCGNMTRFISYLSAIPPRLHLVYLQLHAELWLCYD